MIRIVLPYRQKHIGIVHPQIGGIGGSELRPAWIAQALKNDYKISLITMGNVDFNKINTFAGTCLDKSDILVKSFSKPPFFQSRFAALRGYKLAEYCYENAHSYDLLISTYNVMDFGRRGIQFIADFSFNDVLRRRFHDAGSGLKKILYLPSPVRSMYIKLSEKINRLSEKHWRTNRTIANSEWTKNVLFQYFGIESDVIYPPVPDPACLTSWDRKENGFVYLGRISPEKRIEDIIQIVRRVRDVDRSIHLHLIGPSSDSFYAKKIKNLIQINRDWLSWDGVLVGKHKYPFIEGHRYGISGRRAEPFGISLAEQAKAGCLVWVPDGGGQVEIVNHPILVYKNIDDAVSKIMKVFLSCSLRDELRRHLSARVKLFSIEAFISQVKWLTDSFFSQ